MSSPSEALSLPGAQLEAKRMPGHWLLARLGKRVLRPGGKLLLLEHVRSPLRPIRAVEQLLDPLFGGLMGDHLVREPLDSVHAEKFEVERLERSKLGIF